EAPQAAPVAVPPPAPVAPRPAAPRPAAPVHVPDDADVDYTQFDEAPPKKSGKAGLIGTIAVMVLGAVGLAGYGFWYTRSAENAREMSKLLKTAQEQLSQDSYGAYRTASGTLEQILDVDPEQFAAHAYLAYINILRWGVHGEGETYKQQGEEHIRQAEAHGMDHSHLIAARAYHKFFSGDHAGGAAILEEVLGRDDVTSGLLSGALGSIYLWDGNLEKAQEWLLKANRFSPGDPYILSTLGDLERRKGNMSGSWNYYDQALRFDTGHVESLLGKALIILDNERMESEKADPLIKQVKGLDAQMVSPRQAALADFARAQLLYEQGKTEEARAEEDKALILQGSNPDIRLMIGRRFFREEKFVEAEASIRQAIDLEPKRARFYVELAQVLLKKKGGAKEAVTALEKARATIPNDSKLLILLGDAHAEGGDKGKALAAYNQAITEEGGTFPEAQLAIGKLHRRSGDLDKSIPEFEKALAQFQEKIRPRGQAEASLELAKAYFAKGDHEKSKEWLGKALKNDPSFADTYFFLGKSMIGTKATKSDGQTALENYLKLAPSGRYAEEAKKLLK
ncbi:MAG: tetratricopeptide repeat protein, partial [Deltaproteobacteria bacterium]|nr:tetratricopeptide repeat protein [Deltaproteobacteria bacterium]